MGRVVRSIFVLVLLQLGAQVWGAEGGRVGQREKRGTAVVPISRKSSKLLPEGSSHKTRRKTVSGTDHGTYQKRESARHDGTSSVHEVLARLQEQLARQEALLRAQQEQIADLRAS